MIIELESIKRETQAAVDSLREIKNVDLSNELTTVYLETAESVLRQLTSTLEDSYKRDLK